MQSVQTHQVMVEDGELLLTGLPYKRGQTVDVIVLPASDSTSSGKRLTAGALRGSGLVGLWQDRADIVDGAIYARELRAQAENRWSGSE